MDELRARLRGAEDDAAAARHLAAGADRDVGELGGEFRQFRDQNNRLLSAMRQDLADLRRTMDEGFTEVRTEMRRGFTTAAAAQQRIVELLGSVMRQLDDRPDA